MKKNIIFSLVLSVIICLIILTINLVCANLFKFNPISIKIDQGLCAYYIGFGICLTFQSLDRPVLKTEGISARSCTTSFHIQSLLISIFIIFIIVLVIKTLLDKRKKINK